MAETWQVVVMSTAEILIEVEADTKEQAERYATEAAAEADQSRWEHRHAMEAINSWPKSYRDAKTLDDEPED